VRSCGHAGVKANEPSENAPREYHRPNGPGERSPRLRPQADALGRKAINSSALKGRERFSGPTLGEGSRGLSGRPLGGAF